MRLAHGAKSLDFRRLTNIGAHLMKIFSNMGDGLAHTGHCEDNSDKTSSQSMYQVVIKAGLRPFLLSELTFNNYISQSVNRSSGTHNLRRESDTNTRGHTQWYYFKKKWIQSKRLILVKSLLLAQPFFLKLRHLSDSNIRGPNTLHGNTAL